MKATTIILVLCLTSLTLASGPDGLHTSWSYEGGLFISWADIDSTLPQGSGDPRCSIMVGNDTEVFKANSTTYNDTCDNKRCTTWKGWLHTAEIPARLCNNTKYIKYSCGNDINGFSRNIVLRTRYVPEGDSIQFMFVADIGADLSAPKVSNALYEIAFGYNNNITTEPQLDFSMMAGDIAYANGNQTVWDDFFKVWEPVFQSVPTMFSPGNHDGEWRFGNMYKLPYSGWVNGGESGNAYSLRVQGPGQTQFWKSNYSNVPDMYSNSYWYSAGFGGVRVIATSGTHEFEPGSEQYAWLEEELRKANTPEARAKEPWVVVSNHYPMYCTINDCFCGNYTIENLQRLCEPYDHVYVKGFLELTAYRMVEAFDKLFGEYGVDLFLTGHEHCYERTLPVNNFTVRPENDIPGPNAIFTDPKDTVHIMAGTGGSAPDTKWRERSQFKWSSVRSDGIWSDKRPYGFVKFKVSGDKSELTGEYLNVNVLGRPQVLDNFKIIKTSHKKEVQQKAEELLEVVDLD